MAKIKLRLTDELPVGNLDSMRDWGFAGDYVRAMWLMLQRDKPGHCIIATGVRHAVCELLDAAFSYVNLDYEDYVSVDPRFLRPADVIDLVGDASKARRERALQPEVTFEELVHMMVDHDLKLMKTKLETGETII